MLTSCQGYHTREHVCIGDVNIYGEGTVISLSAQRYQVLKRRRRESNKPSASLVLVPIIFVRIIFSRTYTIWCSVVSNENGGHFSNCLESVARRHVPKNLHFTVTCQHPFYGNLISFSIWMLVFKVVVPYLQ